ncbi:hypothetical protein CRE_12529 [Caenorhabditis remanei]|uniref:Uncharacterized protein n=1 Tax=Caenorhabditis remanei TaxID=31234 RepID=E3M7H0_CAERE|nr:hypothetical protein CRE_12529 [Caenorhabditis remanei]
METWRILAILLIFMSPAFNQSQKKNKNQVSTPPSDCKNVKCFGSANCTMLPIKNMTKCVPVVQKTSSVDDVIRMNLNFTDDFYENSTWTNSTSNSTSSASCVSVFTIVLSITVTFVN